MSDLDFLLNTEEWPIVDGFCSYCCIRRYKEDDIFPELGFLLCSIGSPVYSWTVNTGSIFSGGDGGIIKYDSPEAILADGWLVD